MSSNATTVSAAHPYHPNTLKLEGYVPNERSVTELLGLFFGTLGLCMLGLWVLMAFQKNLKGRWLLKTKISWFFLCGLIHCILEGYFALYHRTLKGEKTFLAECWKEYGQGDSRYITSDTFMVCMESITAFVDGPLAFLATYAFLADRSYRHSAQLVLSLCQLYGDTLYFVTAWKDGFPHGPVGHPLYFWFYFVFLNAFWIVVPLVCVVESWIVLSAAQASIDRDSSSSVTRKLK